MFTNTLHVFINTIPQWSLGKIRDGPDARMPLMSDSYSHCCTLNSFRRESLVVPQGRLFCQQTSLAGVGPPC